MSFVLDNSVAMLWLVPDTNSDGVDYARAALKARKESQALVPSLWAPEAANAIAKVEAKRIVTEAESQRFIALLGRLDSDLDLLIDPTPDTTLFDIGAIRHELLQLLGVPVDVLTPKALPEKFRTVVLSEAVPV